MQLLQANQRAITWTKSASQRDSIYYSFAASTSVQSRPSYKWSITFEYHCSLVNLRHPELWSTSLIKQCRTFAHFAETGRLEHAHHHAMCMREEKKRKKNGPSECADWWESGRWKNVLKVKLLWLDICMWQSSEETWLTPHKCIASVFLSPFPCVNGIL